MLEESVLIQGLNSEAVFESKVYSRKVIKTEVVPRDDGEGVNYYYDIPVDEKVTDWLRQNSLFHIKEWNSGTTYIFYGTNQTLCALHPKLETVEMSDAFRNRDHKYFWRVRVRYQPSDREFPQEIAEALESFGLERKI
jgi:hypothetical protein